MNAADCRIVHVASDAPDKSFGAGHCYYGIETGLIRRGYRCAHVASGHRWDLNGRRFDEIGDVPVVRARNLAVLRRLGGFSSGLSNLVFQFSSQGALRELPEKHKPDVVMGYGCDSLGAVRYAKRRGIPFVHFSFGSLADLLRTYRSERIRWGIERLGYSRRSEAVMLRTLRLQAYFERRLASLADMLIVPCNLRREEAIQNFRVRPDKVAVVPMGVDSNAFQAKTLRREVRARLNISEDSFVFLTVGQSIWRKGLLYLFEAVAGIRAELGGRAKFLLAGFPQRALIGAMIRERELSHCVRCLGPQTHAETVQLYGAADAFVLPSVEEGFGLVLLEAVSAGLPLITAKVGGAPDMFTNGVSALVAEPRDSRALGAALVRVLREPGLRASLRAGGEAVARKYSWEFTTAKLDEIYAKLLH